MRPEEFASIRKILGLTQAELAREMGITQVHIARLETGARIITKSKEKMIRMLKTLHEKRGV